MRKQFKLSLSVLLLFGTAISAMAANAEPLDLRGVSRLTLQNNPALASAGASVAQSEAVLRKTKGMLQPSVTVKSNYGYITKPTFFGTTPILDTNTVINRLEIVQPIYTGGQLQAAVSAADYAAKAVGGGRAAVQSQVLTNSAAAYFRAVQARESIAVADSSVKSLEASYDAAKKLFDSGVVTKSDVLRSEVAVTSARAQLIEANNSYCTALAALKTAIGIPQTQEIELTGNGSEPALSAIDEFPAVQRAEIQAAGFGVKAADAQLRAAQGAQKPSVGVMVDFENQPVGSQFPRLSNTAMIGLQASFNIFNGGQTKASIDEAKASIVKARADMASVSQATEFQLQAARLSVASARARVDTLSTQVTSAEESFRVINAGYKEGINVLTDVLSVESILTGARVSKLAADYDLKIAEINLLLALGQTQKLTN